MASVLLVNLWTGVQHRSTSDDFGRFRFYGVKPGRYLLEARLSGFRPTVLRPVDVAMASSLHYDLSLEVGPQQEHVTVVARAGHEVDRTSEVGAVIAQQQIDRLPVDSRRSLSLALLLPGTSPDSTRPFFDSVNAGASMTFNSTAFLADGVANVWAEDGEPRQDFPQDAIAEFRVSAVHHRADVGFSTGGAIQLVTRSGTNEFHGSAFESFRDDALNARGAFETRRPPFRRHQFGASLGGPIRKDRAHFFGAVELTRVDASYTVTTGLPALYSAVEGTFPRSADRSLYLGRLDWQPSPSHHLIARYAHEDEFTECSGCGGTTAGSAGFDQETPRRSLVFGHGWSIAPSWFNDLRVQYSRGGYYIAPHGSGVWKEVGRIPSERLNRLGRTYIFPSLHYGSSLEDLGPESRWQVRDDLHVALATHSITVGLDYSFLPYTQERTGNPLGTFTFAEDQPFDPRDAGSVARLKAPILFVATVPPLATTKSTQQVALFVQDRWRVTDRVTLEFGMRVEKISGVSNEDLDPSAFPVPLPFVNVARRRAQFHWGPQASLSWDVTSGGRVSARGGYGIHHGHVRVGANLSEYRNFQQFTVTVPSPGYPDPFGGRSPLEFVTTGPTNIVVLADNMRQPYARVMSAGVSARLTETVTLHADVISNATFADRKILDVNPRNADGVRPNAAFARIDRHQPTAELRYRAAYCRAEWRGRRGGGDVSYTYTHSRDNNPLVRYLDPLDPGRDWGPSNGERRHSLVASGHLQLPWRLTVGAVWTLRSQLPWTALAGRDLNGDGFNSDPVPGTRRNAGGRDLDLQSVNKWRAANGLGPVSPGAVDTSRINILDLRLSRTVPLRGRLAVEATLQVFNALNTRNLQAQFDGGRVANALSASFGRILSGRPARHVELGVRLAW
jgi:hypothetical protein